MRSAITQRLPTASLGSDRSGAKACRTDLLAVLLEARASPDSADQKGVRPLHTAAFDGRRSARRRILRSERSGA